MEWRSSHKISELHKGHAYETCKADFHKLLEVCQSKLVILYFCNAFSLVSLML